jgi:hypothetical protein
MEEKEYVMGIDCSTKTIGITLMDTKDNLIDINHISFPKTSKKNGYISIYSKADIFREVIKENYQNYNIKYIFIEEPLKNGPNINTTILLAKFNGIVSQILYEIFNVKPEHITVYEARYKFFPELIVTETVKKKTGIMEIKNILRFPEGDKKQLVFDKVAWLEPQIIWLRNKMQILVDENYDRADSYVVAKSGLLMKGFIKNIPEFEKLTT